MTFATYRLSKHIASFEFYNWLVMVAADGAEAINFDIRNPRTSKWPAAEVLRRFQSIIEPGPTFAGLRIRYGTDVGTLDAVASQLLPWYLSGRRFRPLVSALPPKPCAFTVTIRDNDTAKERDSNRDAWERFAWKIGAIVIDDHRFSPISMINRMALYAGSLMNFGVCNGPIHMLSLTNYPVTMVVNNAKACRSMTKWGMTVGANYPWNGPNQYVEWIADDYDSLCRMFDRLFR